VVLALGATVRMRVVLHRLVNVMNVLYIDYLQYCVYSCKLGNTLPVYLYDKQGRLQVD
jgi:hypothetical protein